MRDDFEPIAQLSVEQLTVMFNSLCKKIKSIDAEVKELLQHEKSERKKLSYKNKKEQRYKIYKQVAEKNLLLEQLNIKKKQLKKELEEKMKNPIPTKAFADEAVQEWNECIGFCYDKCIYVNAVGELLYREATSEDAEDIGEPSVDTSCLMSLSTLPEAEITMIKNYLMQSPNTPGWFKEN